MNNNGYIDVKRNNSSEELNKKSGFTKECFDWVEAIVTAVIVAALIFTFVFRFVNVSGDSMMNTLHNGDKVVVTSFFYSPQQGDVVVISPTEALNTRLIKRVIAVENQTLDINFDTGDVIVNGEVINEPYIKELTKKKGDFEFPVLIPEGYVFVMGDNRGNSFDSRFKTIGLVNVKDILGKAEFIVFPFSRFGGI